MLSPTLSTAFAVISSGSFSVFGKGLMLGPLRTSTLSASSGEAGGSIILSLTIKCSGIEISGASPSCLGSVR